MAAFKKTNINVFPTIGPKTTSDNVFWKRFRNPVLLKEFGTVSHIDFSPIEPNYFAVTCSARVQLYHPITKQVHRNFNRFQKSAHGGVFRSDGRLLAAGSEEGAVRLFDVSSKLLLRVFKGHLSPVQVVKFATDNTHIISFSDDKSVAIWDIPSESRITQYQEHKDYIRSGCTSQASSDIFLSGSYDHTVKLYDTRQDKSVLTIDHESPVESVLMLPSGGIFLSAGSTEIRIWDALAGGRLLGKVSQHHKTITCLRLAQDGKRLLSGSLDRHVKVYDISSYQVVHTLDYPSSVLTLGIAPRDETLAVGMVDGLVSVSNYHLESTEKEIKPKKKASYHYQISRSFRPRPDDLVVLADNREKLSRHDQLLKKFQFSQALDCVLRPYVRNKNPNVTIGVMKELMRRDSLRAAIAGREGKSLAQLLQFVVQHISHVHYMPMLIKVADLILDIYGANQDLPPDVLKYLVRLQQILHRQYRLQKDLMLLEGAIDLILAGATIRNNSEQIQKDVKLKPSESAMTNFVVSVI